LSTRMRDKVSSTKVTFTISVKMKRRQWDSLTSIPNDIFQTRSGMIRWEAPMMAVFQKFQPGIPIAISTTRWVRILSIERIILNRKYFQNLLSVVL
jgi:hypothetical protein